MTSNLSKKSSISVNAQRERTLLLANATELKWLLGRFMKFCFVWKKFTSIHLINLDHFSLFLIINLFNLLVLHFSSIKNFISIKLKFVVNIIASMSIRLWLYRIWHICLLIIWPGKLIFFIFIFLSYIYLVNQGSDDFC